MTKFFPDPLGAQPGAPLLDCVVGHRRSTNPTTELRSIASTLQTPRALGVTESARNSAGRVLRRGTSTTTSIRGSPQQDAGDTGQLGIAGGPFSSAVSLKQDGVTVGKQRASPGPGHESGSADGPFLLPK